MFAVMHPARVRVVYRPAIPMILLVAMLPAQARAEQQHDERERAVQPTPPRVSTAAGILATPLAGEGTNDDDGFFRTLQSPWLVGLVLDAAYSFNDVIALGLGVRYEHVYGTFERDSGADLGARQLVVPVFLRVRIVGNRTDGLFVVPSLGYLSAWNYGQNGATEDGSALRTEGTSSQLGLEYRHEFVRTFSVRFGIAARADFSYSKNGVLYFQDMAVIRTAIPFQIGAAYEF